MLKGLRTTAQAAILYALVIYYRNFSHHPCPSCAAAVINYAPTVLEGLGATAQAALLYALVIAVVKTLAVGIGAC